MDESDEEGRTGLIHATLQGKVRYLNHGDDGGDNGDDGDNYH